jgi:sugar (pentulose or hexulose) kinase
MVGLTLTTSKAQIIKGMFDGLAYEMRRQLDRLADAGANVERIRVVGAGANSQIWLQLKANVYQRPVEGIDVPDALTLGAAMLAGIGSGKYADADDAVAHAVPTVKAVEPDADDVPRYAEQYQRFLRLYPALQPVV